MEYAALKGEAGANVTIKDLGFQTDFTVYLQIRQTWLAFSQYTSSKSPWIIIHTQHMLIKTWDTHVIFLFFFLLSPYIVIILAIVEVIIILLLIFLWKRILIAIALIKEASRSAFILEL